ncbi:MAG: hypothetical protein WBD40_05990 [Tepidisphaeraceae bacterium]
MKTRLNATLALVTCALLTGCATRTETFDVSVKNDSAQPVTIWLTKTAGPEQEGWRSPESVAINFEVGDEPIGGVVVPSGQTAATGKRKGKFDPNSRAVLRVYKGQMTMSELLANGSDSPDRSDVILDPGVNDLVVRDAERKLDVRHADEPAPTTATR